MHSSSVNHCSFLFHYRPYYSVAEIESEHVSSPSQSTHSIPSHWLPFDSTEKENENDCDNLTILSFRTMWLLDNYFVCYIVDFTCLRLYAKAQTFAIVSNFMIKLTTYLSKVLTFYKHPFLTLFFMQLCKGGISRTLSSCSINIKHCSKATEVGFFLIAIIFNQQDMWKFHNLGPLLTLMQFSEWWCPLCIILLKIERGSTCAGWNKR